MEQEHQINISSETLKPITGEEVLKAILDSQFTEVLDEAGEFTRKTGYEAGFDIDRNIYTGKNYYSKVSKGNTYSMESSQETKNASEKSKETKEDDLHYEDGDFLLFSLHFHTTSLKYIIIPSFIYDGEFYSGDILAQNIVSLTVDDVPYNPIEAIALVDDNNNKRLLLYQALHFRSLDEIPETKNALLEDLPQATNQEEVLSILRDNMYRAEIINIDAAGNISEKDQSKIKKFTVKFKELSKANDEF